MSAMKNMKITIPYTYTAQVKPPRCRLFRDVRQEASITLTIREVTTVEAPVAIIEHDRDWDEEARMIPNRREYRWFRNRLWIPYVFRDDCNSPWQTQTVGQFSAEEFHKGNEWQSKAENRKRFQAATREILFIDGQRWEQAGEPRYVIMTYGLGHNHGIGWGTSLSTDNFYNSNITRERYYRIDQFEEAVAAATLVAQRRGDTKALPIIEEQNPTRYDILIPESVRLNPRREHGKGCSFINQCEALIEGAPSANVAGIFLLGALASGQ